MHSLLSGEQESARVCRGTALPYLYVIFSQASSIDEFKTGYSARAIEAALMKKGMNDSLIPCSFTMGFPFNCFLRSAIDVMSISSQ